MVFKVAAVEIGSVVRGTAAIAEAACAFEDIEDEVLPDDDAEVNSDKAEDAIDDGDDSAEYKEGEAEDVDDDDEKDALEADDDDEDDVTLFGDFGELLR